jgi:hypothetical protein
MSELLRQESSIRICSRILLFGEDYTFYVEIPRFFVFVFNIDSSSNLAIMAYVNNYVII